MPNIRPALAFPRRHTRFSIVLALPTSPRALLSGPREFLHSPHELLNSPVEFLNSPLEFLTCHAENLSSPLEKLKSQVEKLESPRKKRSYPLTRCDNRPSQTSTVRSDGLMPNEPTYVITFLQRTLTLA